MGITGVYPELSPRGCGLSVLTASHIGGGMTEVAKGTNDPCVTWG